VKKTYMDYLYMGHYFKYGGEFTFSPSAKTEISLFAMQHKSGTRGDTVYQNRRYDDEAGAAYSSLDIGLAVRFRLTGRG